MFCHSRHPLVAGNSPVLLLATPNFPRLLSLSRRKRLTLFFQFLSPLHSSFLDDLVRPPQPLIASNTGIIPPPSLRKHRDTVFRPLPKNFDSFCNALLSHQIQIL